MQRSRTGVREGRQPSCLAEANSAGEGPWTSGTVRAVQVDRWQGRHPSVTVAPEAASLPSSPSRPASGQDSLHAEEHAEQGGSSGGRGDAGLICPFSTGRGTDVRRRVGSPGQAHESASSARPASGVALTAARRGPPRNLAPVTTDRRPAVATDPQPAHATEALERLGRLPLRQLSMEDLLQTVADLTATLLPGAAETSVTLLVRGNAATVASTGQLAVHLDETQYERGHGPCLHAARTGELTVVADTRTDGRWPDYLPRAAEHGCLSSLSAPLVVDEEEQISGALNVYARRPDAFDEGSRAVAARTLATRAASRCPPVTPLTPLSQPATCTSTRGPVGGPSTSGRRSSRGPS